MLKHYAIVFTAEETTAINSGKECPKFNAYREGSALGRNRNPEFHNHVATVDTNCKDEAFELMNLWEVTEKVTLINGVCPSMSVGDFVEDENGNRWWCAMFGWEADENNK